MSIFPGGVPRMHVSLKQGGHDIHKDPALRLGGSLGSQQLILAILIANEWVRGSV